MAELHVQRKRSNYIWLWLLIIIIVAAAGVYYYIHYYRKDNLVVNEKPTSYLQKENDRIFTFNKIMI
jgi:cell division protein FtsL